MYKILKIFLCLLVVLIIGLYLFDSASPVRSMYAKYIMDKEDILSKFEFMGRCRYFKPKSFMFPSNPQYQCLSSRYFNEKDQVEELIKMGDILKQNGWVASPYNTHNKDVTYLKDNLSINSKVYNWVEPNANGEYLLLTILVYKPN